MKRFLKIFLWTVFSIVVVLAALLAGFLYKVQYGFPVSYETEVPAIAFPDNQKTVLLFSKATGFVHSESIDAGKETFARLAKKNNWFLYSTDEGGVFNPDQLAKFDVVIFNNCTGRVLNDDQQKSLEEYVESGSTLIGIHGAGDNSHHWDWYTQNLPGVLFSHHTLHPQFQEATVMLNAVPDTTLTKDLASAWTHSDEWYVFFENPRDKGFNILYTIDGEKIYPNGNILWMRDKDFGMGKDHPVAWYRATGNGRTFYTSMGHNAGVWKQEAFVKMLENAITGK